MTRAALLAAILAACGDNTTDWRPERETVGTFSGELGELCTCAGGPPFHVTCCRGGWTYPLACQSEPITIDLNFYDAQTKPDLRQMTTEQFHRNGLTGFVDLTTWFDATVIDDPRGTGARYRTVGIDNAVARAQPLCIVETGQDCVDFAGFALKDFRVWCEVTP